MTKFTNLKDKILSGNSDQNIEFHSLCQLLLRLGFEYRIKGSHHIFTHRDMTEIINLQPKGGLAKAYQVKQVRGILLKYKLGETVDD